jgi:Glyoxalase-like domain
VSVAWGLTVDCARPGTLATFWSVALGYVEPPPPTGSASWAEWLTAQGVPPQEWDDAAYLADPEGTGPTLSFLRVPEPKSTKNRLHVDVKVSGGRGQPAELRRQRIQDAVDRLVDAGATVERYDDPDGVLDHVVMADPEGNEFCVV